MKSSAQYYPEFDSTEVDETIKPLAAYDAEVLAVLDDGRSPVRQWAGQPEEYPFQQIVRGLAAGLVDHDPIGGYAGLFADPGEVLFQLLRQTEARLNEVCTRPLVAAINEARENGALSGATAQDRYRDFVEQARRTSLEAVSGLHFPVLADVVRLILRNERTAFRELCRRLSGDRQAIEESFGIAAGDPLVSIGQSEGDTHNHGRSVRVLVFASGTRLVYKPRDVSCEAAYDTLAHELNARLGLSLASARVLERERYGYVEFIQAEEVADRPAEFMAASGELAAVLYLLNARDMHFENILPTRRGPLPIDLETIMHPNRIHAGPVPEAPANAYTTISQSIYGIGILPLVMAGKDGGGHVDLGFLGDQGRGTSPFRTMRFDNAFTDEITLVLRSVPAAPRQTVVNALTEAETYELGERMAEGFARVFRLVMADRESWEALLRKTAAGVRVRYVHNPTALYSQTLRMTSGPGALDGTEPYLALLKRIAIASRTSDRAIVRAELRQLAERDIPYFTVASTSTALTDGDGREVGAFFAESPLDVALGKSATMSEFELGEQLRLIHSAFSSRFPDNHLVAGDPAPGAPGAPAGQAPREDLAGILVELADRMVATARPDRFGHLPQTWIGPLASADADRPWPPGVLGYELYTGRTGPALALAAAGRLLGDRRYLDLSGQIFSTTADILSSRGYETRSLRQAGYGGYTGMAGILFALASAGRLLGEDGWTTAAQDSLPLVMDQVREQAPRGLPLDVITGVAGVLSCVLAIDGPHAGAAALDLTGLLVGSLQNGGPAAQAVLRQSGFAHGISGVVHALSRAYPRLPESARPAVRATLDVLIGRLGDFYDPAEQGWFSDTVGERSFSTGWCHGATGIALGLSAYHGVTGDARCAALRDLAVARTLQHGFGRNLTWCHGDLGNHDALRSLVPTADATLAGEVAAIEDRWLRPEVLNRKIHDSRSRYAHTDSLLVGTAGIVLHLANRLDPAAHLSAVRLTSPAARTTEER